MLGLPCYYCAWQLQLQFNQQQNTLSLELSHNGQVLHQQQYPVNRQAQQTKEHNKFSMFGLMGLGFKLFKSAKLVQVALVGASAASYAYLFTWQFALILIMALMFHELGHVQAMKKMGLKVKGIYLIPFLGGAAVSEDRIQTRWQNVFISMMGPVYGLVLTLIFLLVYQLTGLEIAGGLAALSAFLNLINLLPIFPLDGGHVLKSITFSLSSRLGLFFLGLGLLLCLFITLKLGLWLFVLLIVIGAMDLLATWRQRQSSQLAPMNRYACMVAAAWYLVTIALLLGCVYVLANQGFAAAQLVLQVLSS